MGNRGGPVEKQLLYGSAGVITEVRRRSSHVKLCTPRRKTDANLKWRIYLFVVFKKRQEGRFFFLSRDSLRNFSCFGDGNTE